MARNKEFDPAEKLEMARNLFWEKGYNATSMQDLVDTMGLNRGSIYDTYGDKHSLYLQCLTDYVNKNACACNSMAQMQGTPLEVIGSAINAIVESSLDSKKSCMAVKSTFELANCDEDVRLLAKKNVEQTSKVFQVLIVKAQEAGEIKSDINPALLADFIVSSFSGFSQNYALFRNPKQVRKMAALLIESLGSE